MKQGGVIRGTCSGPFYLFSGALKETCRTLGALLLYYFDVRRPSPSWFSLLINFNPCGNDIFLWLAFPERDLPAGDKGDEMEQREA